MPETGTPTRLAARTSAVQISATPNSAELNSLTRNLAGPILAELGSVLRLDVFWNCTSSEVSFSAEVRDRQSDRGTVRSSGV